MMHQLTMRTWSGTDDDQRDWSLAVATKSSYNNSGRPDGLTIEATCPDGTKREVWIEINNGDLVVHAYDPTHDEPLNIRVAKDSITTDNDRNGEGITHVE